MGQHARAREDRRTRHGSAGGVRRARAAGARHGDRPRRDRERLLRDRDGGDGRSRRAVQDPRQLRAEEHQGTAASRRVHRRRDPRSLHDGAARRHRRRELPYERRHQGGQARAERREDADQPRRRSTGLRRLQPREQAAGARRHRLRLDRARYTRIRVHRALPHDGRREPRGDPVQQLRAAAGEPDHQRGRLPQAPERVQHAALSQPQRVARPRGRRVRRGGQIRARSHRVRPPDRRVPGDAPQARGDVSRHRSEPLASCIARARRRTRSRIRTWPRSRRSP